MPLTQSYPSMFWQQFHDENGNPLANGTVKTFLASDHSMPVQTYTYPGSGVKNPTNITLDDAGKCVMALEIGLAYYIEVYDVNNNLKGTFDNVTAGGGTGEGGEHLTFTSSDGSITITRVGDNVDLKVVKDTDIYGTVEGYGTNSSGIITFTRIVEGDITLDSGNIVVDPYKLYHLTVHLDFSNNSAGNLYKHAKLIDSEAHEHMFTVDQSLGKNYIEVSFDIVPSREYISLQLENTGSSLSSALVYIHRVNPVVGSNSGGGGGDTYTAGYGININSSNEISANINDLKLALTTKAWHVMHGSTWSDSGDLLGYIVEDGTPHDPENLITIEKWTNEDSEHNVIHCGKLNLKAGHSYMLISSMWFSRKPSELAPTLNNIAFYVGGSALGINGARQEFLYNNSQMNEVCPQVTAFIPASNVDTYITLQCSGGVDWYDFKPDYLWIAALN